MTNTWQAPAPDDLGDMEGQGVVAVTREVATDHVPDDQVEAYVIDAKTRWSSVEVEDE